MGRSGFRRWSRYIRKSDETIPTVHILLVNIGSPAYYTLLAVIPEIKKLAQTGGMEQTLRGSFPPPGLGGRTRGTPKHVSLGHSSASIAHPLRRRLPISVDARSDCCLRLRISSVSTGTAKVGELSVLEISVGGVDLPDMVRLSNELGSELRLAID
jgi:hypothetical protein